MSRFEPDDDAREGLRILAVCLVAAVSYGTALDFVTIAFFPTYLTEFHPRILDVRNPLALAFVWGFLGSWWVGFFGSLPIIAAARLGNRLKITSGYVAKILLAFLSICFVGSNLAGLAAYDHPADVADSILGRAAGMGDFTATMLANRGFVAMYLQHALSYRLAGVAVLVLSGWLYRRRPLPCEG